MKHPSDIRILIACEYSAMVRQAFERKVFYVQSCDLLPTRIPGNHYQGSVLDILNDNWNVLIGFPPCTYLSNVNTRWRGDIDRLKKTAQAIDFFATLYSAPIEKIALENPTGILSTVFRKPDQIIHPYYFGGQEKKQTCLWLKNLPTLKHTRQDTLFERETHGKISEEFKMDKARQTPWFNNNKKERSTLFPSIAQAMADQWTPIILNS